jgi:hypothetical protein
VESRQFETYASSDRGGATHSPFANLKELLDRKKHS